MRVCKEDIDLIGGKFLLNKLPSDKAWMFKYFRSEKRRALIVYLEYFGNVKISLRGFCRMFTDHTGYVSSLADSMKTKWKFDCLKEAVATATNDKDLATLSEIKMGNWKYQCI